MPNLKTQMYRMWKFCFSQRDAPCPDERLGGVSWAVVVVFFLCTTTVITVLYLLRDNVNELALSDGGTSMSNETKHAVLGDDFATAQSTLRKAIADKKQLVIETALESLSYAIKTEAAAALARVGNKKSVPKLRDALEKHRLPGFGGTELKMDHRDFVLKTVGTLTALTGEDYGSVDPASPEAIQGAVTQTDNWLSANQR